MPRCLFIIHASTVANYLEMTGHHHHDPPLWGHLDQGRSRGTQLIVQDQSSADMLFRLRTAFNLKTCPVFSWKDSIPGCSSRCSDSHSCHTVVAGNQSQSQKKLTTRSVRCIWRSASESGFTPGTSRCILHIRPALPPLRHYHLPQVAVWWWGPVALRTGFLPTHPHWNHRRPCAASQARRRCKSQGIISYFHTIKMFRQIFRVKVLTKLSSPVFWSSLGSSQLIQQLLMSIVHRQHTVVVGSHWNIGSAKRGSKSKIMQQRTEPSNGAAVLLSELQSSLWEDDLCVGGERRSKSSRHTLLHCLSRGPGVPRQLQLQQVHVQFVIILNDARQRKKIGQFYIFSF